MNSSRSYFMSTIGRKHLVAVTGLALCGFVLSHALANLLIIISADAYNLYSHALISNPLIYVAEAILGGLFLTHIVLAIGLSLRNKKARPVGYAARSKGPKAVNPVAANMKTQGIVLLLFLIYHLVTFKFGTYYETTVDGVVMRDLHRLVIEVFQSPLYTFGYVFCMFVLTLHLSHGFSSAIQTFGIHHPEHTKKFKVLGVLFGIFIGVSFAVQPLYVFFLYKG